MQQTKGAHCRYRQNEITLTHNKCCACCDDGGANKPVHALATIRYTKSHTDTRLFVSEKSRLTHAYTCIRTHTHNDRLLSSSSHLPRPRWIHYPLPRRRAEFAWWPAFGLVHIPHRRQHPRWPCCFRRWGWRLWIYMYFTCGLNTKNKYTLRWCTHTCAYSSTRTHSHTHKQACRHSRNLE